MRRDTLMVIEYFYRVLCRPDVYFFARILKWYRVKFVRIGDMTVKLHFRFGPLSGLIR